MGLWSSENSSCKTKPAIAGILERQIRVQESFLCAEGSAHYTLSTQIE